MRLFMPTGNALVLLDFVNAWMFSGAAIIVGSMIHRENEEGRIYFGLLFHSDQGVQYVSSRFKQLLMQNRIIASMSRKGNAYDNAVIESFFNSLKQGWLHHRTFATRAEAKQSILVYIETFYNRHRLHSTLGYKSPDEYGMLNGI